MKKFFTSKPLIVALSFFVLIILMSNSSGRGNIAGQAVTGAPGDSNRTCASSGCHSSGSFSPSADLRVTDDNGNLVDGFIPGETYNLSLNIDATGDPAAYGFQMIALKEDNSPADDWSETGANIRVVGINNRDYIEHNSPSASNEFKTKWTAPEEGSGDVTFYFSANAVNGNGGTSGDGGTNSNFVLSELTTSTSELTTNSVTLYPMPAVDFVTISGDQSEYKYAIYDLNGQNIRSGQFNGQTTIETTLLSKGLYFVTIQDDVSSTTKKLIVR